MTMPSPRPEILTIHPYVAGKSAAPGANRIIKLSSNEGAFGVPPSVRAAIAAVGDELHRYPDGSAVRLRAALGKRWNLDPDRIVCGAGSDDVSTNSACPMAAPGATLSCPPTAFRCTKSPASMRAVAS